MNKKSLIISIVSIASAVLLLLGVGIGLSGVMAVNEEKELDEMLHTLLPGSTTFTWEDCEEEEDSAIRAAYKGENGFVIQTVAYGYSGDITLLVGVTNEGQVTGLVVRDMSETYGLGKNALTDTKFLAQFLGTSGEAEVGNNVDAITGATVTSKAVTKAVNSAVAYVTGADTSSSATEWGG